MPGLAPGLALRRETRMTPSLSLPQRRALRALSFAYFVQATGSLAVSGSLVPIAREWAISESQSAWLLALFGITFALAAPLSQVLFGHLPRRKLVLYGAATFGGGAFLFSLAPDYGVLAASRIVMGLGASLMGPVLVGLGAELAHEKERGSAIAKVLFGLSLASMLGIPLAAWLADAWGPRALFGAVGAVSLLVALNIRLTVPETGAGVRIRLSTIGDVLTNAKLLSAFLVVFFIAAGVFATYAFIAPVVRDSFHGTAHDVSVALAVLGIAGIVGNLAVARAARHFSAERLLVAGIGLLMVDMLLMLAAPPHLSLLFAAFTVWAFATDILWPTQQRRIVEVAGPWRGIALALTSAFMFCGIGFGSAVAAWVYPRFGYGGLLGLSVLLLVLALASLAVSERAKRREQEKCAAPCSTTRILS